MKDKFFTHPLTEIAATPRGYGKDDYMAVFIENTIQKLKEFEESSGSADFHGLDYIASLKRALEWLLEYFKGNSAVEDDCSIYSYYAWIHLKKLDEDLMLD